MHKLEAGKATVPLPQIVRPSRMVVAAGNGDVEWATKVLNRELGGLPVAEVEPTPGGAAWWGTSKLVESVVYPVDVAELVAELVDELEPWICRWCRELVASAPCPLCGHRGRLVRRRAAGAPAQQGVRR